jgi:Rieske 2Fe-2S family protein
MKASEPSSPRIPGHTLAREYYVSPEIFERDVEKVFFRHWLYAGHESQLPNPGDFFTYEIAGESIVIVRRPEGDLRAFFNVCRHRGARFVQQPCGSVRALQCRYHNWTYGLDGALKVAPGMPDMIGKEQLGLIPAWVEVWHGMIYLNLSPARPAVRVGEMLLAAEPAVKPFRFENAKVARTITYEVKSNWKLFMENYRECYHCLSNHPEFCATVPVGRGVALHQNTANIRIIHAPNLTFSNYPLRPGARTQSIDGELVSIPFGDLKLTDELIASPPNYYLNFYPAHGFVFNLDYAMTFSVHPRDAGHTSLKVDWYVNRTAIEGVDYDVNRLIAFWDVTHRQDLGLCEMNQQGVDSRRYVPGPYNPHEEDDVEHLMKFYVNAISA